MATVEAEPQLIKESESGRYPLICRLLKAGDKKRAARLLWPWLVPNEWRDRIYHALDKSQYLCIMGHGSAAKTFTSCEWFLLDWWTDPRNTALVITSDTLGSMNRRVWSDMKRLFMETSISMPGILIDSRKMIVHSQVDHKNAIAGIAAEDKDSQTKVQGLHTKRIRVLIDEADNKDSQSIWKAISNLGTSGELKVVALANPSNRMSEFGRHCEPVNGWSSINAETDYEWTSTAGWRVLRLDGMKSPNIMAGYDKFPFLLTNKGLDDIRTKRGINSQEWWAYVRAMYAPQGDKQTIFSSEILLRTRQPLTWYAQIRPVASCDPALEEGGDDCVLALGHMGKLAGDPRKTGLKVERMERILITDPRKPISIDKGDQILAKLKAHGVAPEDFAIDCTGEGRGISDYIQHAWSGKQAVKTMPVRFGGSPTDMTITTEDSTKASDRFDRFVSELWYVAREWCRLGLVWIPDGLASELSYDLESRLYELLGAQQKISIESKQDMKKRGLKSPDFGDSLCLLIHLVRSRSQGFTPGIFERRPKTDSMTQFKKRAYVGNATYGVASS